MAAIGQERDEDVTSYMGFTGLRDDIPPDRFAITDLAVADNVDLDKSGKLTRRDGYTVAKTDPHAHSLWADDSGLLALYMAGTQLKKLNTDYTSTTLSTVTSAGRMAFCRANDSVYFSNGVDKGVYNAVANTVRSWGMPQPGAIGIAVSVGVLPAGRYQVAMTYLRSDGQESGAGAAQYVDVPDGSSLQLTLPVSFDPDVVGKVVYATTQNGNMLYQLQAVANVTTSLAYNGGDLSRPLETQFLQEPPAGQLVAHYRGRMYVAKGDVLFCSTEFGYELFDIRNYIQLDGNITLLAVITDKDQIDSATNSGLFIGTDRSCGVLVGSNPTDFQYVPKINYGAITGTLAMVDGSVYGDGSATARLIPMWLTTNGVCAGMPGMQINNITRTKYTIPAAGEGAALFMPGPNRIILTYNL
jgi:hypothetical protein